MNKQEQAVELYNKGYLCSQAIFATFCEEFGIQKDIGIKLSNFLGAGFMFQGNYCGAVSGALMVYSLKYSSSEKYSELSNETLYQVSQEHMKRFTEKQGSCICKELLNADLSTEEGMSYLIENKIFDKKCPAFVEDSTEIITQIIAKMDSKLERL